MLRFLLSFFLIFTPIFALAAKPDINLRDSNVSLDSNVHPLLQAFSENGWIAKFFFGVELAPGGVEATFVNIAGAIKNFFIMVAVIFLVIGIIKLLFRSGEEEDIKKWRNNIIYVSIGIFVMQIGYSVWKTLTLESSNSLFPTGNLGWLFWINILEPIVSMLLVLSTFGFLAMAVYAFYILITAGGDEEKAKKGKSTFLYALVGFLLIRIPKLFIMAIYGEPAAACKNSNWVSIGSCTIEHQNIGASISLFGKILTYISSFLGLFAVVLVIYAGWLVFFSGGDEEKLKKAKNIVIYLAIGFIALIGSHIAFKFFFLGTAG